jgi:hypothetical protein
MIILGNLDMSDSYLDTRGTEENPFGTAPMIRGTVMHMNCEFSIINCTLVPGIVFYVNPHGIIENSTFMSMSMQKNTPERLVTISNCTITPNTVTMDEASRALFIDCNITSCFILKGNAEAILRNTTIGGLNVFENGTLTLDNIDYILEYKSDKSWNHVRDNSSVTMLNSSYIQKLYLYGTTSLNINKSSINNTIMKEGVFASIKDGKILNLSAINTSEIWLQGSSIEKYELGDDARICNITTLTVETELNLQPLPIPIVLTDNSAGTIASSETDEQGKAEFTLVRDIISIDETSMKPELSQNITQVTVSADYEKMQEEAVVQIDSDYAKANLEFEDYSAPVIEDVSYDIDPYLNTNEKVLISTIVMEEETSLKNLTLVYSVNDGDTWEEMMMYNTGQNLYQNSIPGQSDGTKVRFYIIAEDGCGNKVVSQYYTYTAGEGLVMVNNLIIITGIIVVLGLITIITTKVLWSRKKVKNYTRKTGE